MKSKKMIRKTILNMMIKMTSKTIMKMNRKMVRNKMKRTLNPP